MPTDEINSVPEMLEKMNILMSATNLRWWFRGHSSAAWHLEPKVRRGYSQVQEKYFTNEFFVRAKLRSIDFPEIDDQAGQLAMMQHHGLPTRLLDWSRSPLIAAFFATERFQPYYEQSIDGPACIWALAPIVLNVRQGFEDFLYPMSAKTVLPMIEPAFKTRDDNGKVISVMAVETDLRMLIQQGAFTVHATDVPLDLMADCSDWLIKYIIPTQSIPSMARDLDILGIRRGDLFPDLDNLATELMGIHQPRH
jgi:hypothetical protein